MTKLYLGAVVLMGISMNSFGQNGWNWPEDKDVAEEHIKQVKGYVHAYQLQFEQLELLEVIMKKRLNNLKDRKK